MPASERTKQLLADGLKEMAATMPLRKIRVSMLCQQCGVDRRTFYYHFRDVYDLTAWIFDRTINLYLPLRDGKPTEKGLVKILSRFRKDEVFYRCALAEDSQNALGRHYLSSIVEMYTALVLRAQGKFILSEEDRFLVNYHSFGALGMIRRWIFSEPERSPEEMARLILLAMPPVIRTLYEEGSEKGDRREIR